MPFLLKVLSVGKALSIQAHPDLTLAAKLFKEQPDVYKARPGPAVSRPRLTLRRRPRLFVAGRQP